ncbi:hypothetical protein EIP86_003990 [Pleurotus ostreatoroseus]|nr:hypothetical protein EIP86_003990 [Pleurotus ostreatoroseus]
MSMFDPLSSTFGEEPPPPWPTTPRTPNTPIPNLPRPSRPVTPVTPEKAGDAAAAGPGGGLYGRQPQIYGQPEPGLVSPTVTTGANGAKYERNEPYLRVRITGLDRNRRDILIKFDAQTNLSNFTGTTYRNVSRSYYEFQQFYDAIVHSNPQTIIPALPLAQTSAPTDEEDDRLVKIMLQRWLARICDDPILVTEEEVRSFIESDFGYQPTPAPKRKTSSGFSLIRRAVPDEDEELQRARFELTKLETQFFDAAKAIDKLAKARKSLSTVRSEMGNKFVNVATTEAHPPLGNAMRKLGRAYHSLSDLDQAQAISECVIIGDTLGYQGLNARSAKETLQQRTSVLEEYQAAVKTTISKRRNIERLKASRNIGSDKVDEALEELEEANNCYPEFLRAPLMAERYEQILARRAEGISQNLHRALARHKRLVTEDVTTALIEHIRSSIMYERQHLRELDALRTDVGNAASKYVAAKPPAPRPTVIPPLEDYAKPPIPRPASGMSNGISPASVERTAPAPSMPAPAGPVSSIDPLRARSPLRPAPTPQSPSSMSQSATLPRPPPSFVSQANPNPNADPLQSPGAGPSSPGRSPSFRSPSFGPAVSDGPPLGGRFVDGTKSMFVKHTPSPLAPSGAGAGPSSTPSTPSTPSKGAFQSPLHSAPPLTNASGAAHPLGHSVSVPSLDAASRSANASVNGRAEEGLDPLGMARPAYMSQSVRVQPTRPRLDAREAASKLANMF